MLVLLKTPIPLLYYKLITFKTGSQKRIYAYKKVFELFNDEIFL